MFGKRPLWAWIWLHSVLRNNNLYKNTISITMGLGKINCDSKFLNVWMEKINWLCVPKRYEVFLNSKNRENWMPNNTFDKLDSLWIIIMLEKFNFFETDKLNQLWLLFWKILQLLGAKNNLAITSTFVVQNWCPWSSSKE